MIDNCAQLSRKKSCEKFKFTRGKIQENSSKPTQLGPERNPG